MGYEWYQQNYSADFSAGLIEVKGWDINPLDTIELTSNNSPTVIWNTEEILQRAFTGTEGDDVIYGDADDNTLVGNAGNDAIYGGDGNDVITDGAGSDTIDGGAGNDVIHVGHDAASPDTDNRILFGLGDGNDVVTLRGTALDVEQMESTTIIFKPGLSAGDVELSVSSDNPPAIIFTLTATGETLTLSSDFISRPQLLSFRFDDGGANSEFEFDGVSMPIIIEQAGSGALTLQTVIDQQPYRVDNSNSDGMSVFEGSSVNENLLAGGLSEGSQSISGGGGSDALTFDADDTSVSDIAILK